MNEQTQNIDIRAEREKFLKELERQVDLAFTNRRQEKLLPSKKNTKEAIERAKEQKGWFEGLPDDYFVDLGEYKEGPFCVSVTNPHDYRNLLIMCLNKLVEASAFEKNEIGRVVEEILEHELGHHVPALGQEGLQIRYAVEFFEDRQERFMGIRPKISLSGKMQVGVYKDIIGAVKKPSTTDIVE